MLQWLAAKCKVLTCALIGLMFAGLIISDGLRLLPRETDKWLGSITWMVLGAGAIILVACFLSNRFDLNFDKFRPQIMAAILALSVVALISINPVSSKAQPDSQAEALNNMSTQEQLAVQEAAFEKERETLARNASRQNIAALAVGGLIALATRLLEAEKKVQS